MPRRPRARQHDEQGCEQGCFGCLFIIVVLFLIVSGAAMEAAHTEAAPYMAVVLAGTLVFGVFFLVRFARNLARPS